MKVFSIFLGVHFCTENLNSWIAEESYRQLKVLDDISGDTYQYHISIISVPYQYHISTIPVPYQYHTSTISVAIEWSTPLINIIVVHIKLHRFSTFSLGPLLRLKNSKWCRRPTLPHTGIQITERKSAPRPSGEISCKLQRKIRSAQKPLLLEYIWWYYSCSDQT